VISDLTSKGYEVFLPICDYLIVDFIAVNKDLIPKRFQVKYKGITKERMIEIPLSTNIHGKRKPMNLTQIDALAIYNPVDSGIYYVSTHDLHGKYFFCSLVDDGKQKSALCNSFCDPSKIWEG
jgi:hypothetical protein